MSRSPRVLGLALCAAAISAAAPGAASAAEAPMQLIGTGGTVSPGAVSADGRSVLSGIGWAAPRVYDATTGAYESLPLGSSWYRTTFSASSDLQRVLFDTKDSFSPQDTNDDSDLYVYDRRTDTKTLVTANPAGGSLTTDEGPTDSLTTANDVTYAKLSGDGSTALFGIQHYSYSPGASGPTRTFEDYRLTLTSGALTKISTAEPLPVSQLDDAGRVFVTRGGTYVNGRKLVTPVKATGATISPDGGTVAFWNWQDMKSITVLNTANNTLRFRAVPAWLVTAGYNVWGVENGGANLLVGALLARTPTEKPYVFGKLTVASGELLHWGGDIRVTRDSNVSAISPTWDFAITNTHVAQLGSRPLPGGRPPVVPGPFNAADYAKVGDATCINNFWYQSYTKPGIYLESGAIGSDLRRPTKAVVVVTKDSSTWTYTLAPGTGKLFEVGANGRWSATVTVTLDDGATAQYSQTIPQHAKPVCDPFPL